MLSASSSAQHALARVALEGSHRRDGTVDGARSATGLCARSRFSGIEPRAGCTRKVVGRSAESVRRSGQPLACGTRYVVRKAGKPFSVHGRAGGSTRTKFARVPGYVKRARTTRWVARVVISFALASLLTASVMPKFSVTLELQRRVEHMQIEVDSFRMTTTSTTQLALARVALEGSHRQHGTVDGARSATGLCARSRFSGIVPRAG
jgi:hypothetical protein